MPDNLCTPGMFQPPRPELVVPPSGPRYEFTCIVRRRDTYNREYVSKVPASVFAETIDEATDKLRDAFGAKYDDFRKFWSHSVLIESVKEVR